MENYYLKLKKCYKCEKEKPLIYFGHGKTNTNKCLECSNRLRKEYNRKSGRVSK